MRSRRKERLLALLLTVVMTGSLCTGIETAAKEAEQDGDAFVEETTEQNEKPTEETLEAEETAEKEEAGEKEEAEETKEAEAIAEKAEEEIQMKVDPMIDEVRVQEDTEEKALAGEWCYEFEKVKWSLNNNTLTVSGTGSTWRLPDEYADKMNTVTKVIINEGITEIDGLAFSGCNNLESIVIPKSVTQIDDFAFSECSSLESVVIPSKVKKISFGTFQGCVSLKSITIPKSVTQIDNFAFERCSALKSVTIPESVTEIDEFAFAGCSALKSITIPSKVGEIGNSAFIACNNLKKVVILSKTKYTRIGSTAFGKCSHLVDITLPNGEVGIGSGAFEQCSRLSSIIIPEGVTDIGNYAFHTCNNLKSIVVKNKSCRIWGDGDTISSTATIYGYAGSTAQDYAKCYNRKFVKLKEPVVKVTKVSISGISKKIAYGKKIALKASVSPSTATNKAVTWKSSNKKYATVTSKGVVTMKKAGRGKTVTITATAKDGSKKKATYKIKCMKGAVKKVAISGKSKRTLKAGKSVTLKASVKTTVKSSKDVNKTLKWTTSNKKYATVTSKGKVKTLKAGKGKKVKITAAATDGSGKKATVTITLK